MTSRRINQISLVLLLIGFSSALAIYLTADHTPVSSLLDDPLANKKYIRQLRMIGGKANVLAAEIQDWFDGLWHGESLPWTVAALTGGVALVFRFAARRAGSKNPPSD